MKESKVKNYSTKNRRPTGAKLGSTWVQPAPIDLAKLPPEDPIPRIMPRESAPWKDIMNSNYEMDTDNMEMYDMYVFLNRNVLKSILNCHTTQPRIEDILMQKLKSDFKFVNEEIFKSGSYYSNWLDLCLEKTLEEFSKETEKTKGGEQLMISLEKLFTSIKLFSSTISETLFNMRFKTETIMENISTPDEFYLVPIFDMIFNKKQFNRDSLRKSILKSTIKTRTFPLREVYTKALLEDNQQLIDMFEKNRKTVEPELHPFLILDERSLDIARQSLKGKEKVEFVHFIRDRATMSGAGLPLKKKFRKPYLETVTYLELLRKADSPFEKAVHILNTIRHIQIEIVQFFRSNMLEAAFSLTSEELFPIAILLLKYLGECRIIIDLYITDTFLPAELKMADAGYYTNLFITAYYFIANQGNISTTDAPMSVKIHT